MISGKPIAHFERKYIIHPNGQVWNLGKNSWQTQTQNPNGYMKVQLKLNGRHDQLLVHRVVALHFIPNPYGHPQVNHLNGDKTHNDVSNLEWVSREENIQHSLATGLRAGFMSIPEKEELLTRIFNGEQVQAVATEIGRHPVVLSKMLRNHATKIGRDIDWTQMMKQRRKDAAVRNLDQINARNTGRGEDQLG
jgi:hypothetical protein